MANNTSIQNELQPRIDAFIQEISDLVRRAALSSVREALQGDGSAPARRGPGRPRKVVKKATTRKARAAKAGAPAKRTGRPGRRSPQEVDAAAQQILEHVRANPGQRSEEIKTALGLRPEDFKLPVFKLLADGKVRTEGKRRGTKYFTGSGGGGRKAGKMASKRAGKKRGTKAGKRKTTKKGAATASATA